MTRKIVIIVAIALFILKFPFRSRLLSWWDSAQFGLALERFSVIEHRPHPPGYPLYILLGKTLTYITHDPAVSFVLIGLVSSIIATVIVFYLAREFTGRYSVGLIAAAIYAFAPLTFYHELKALTYVISAFFSSLVAWECLRIISLKEKNPWRVAVTLGFMGMVRPFESILLLPLAIWVVSRLGLKKFIGASLLYIVFQIAWLIPTALLSGGFDKYIGEFIMEAGKHKRNIESMGNRPIAKLALNFKAIYYYMRQSFPFWGWLVVIPVVRALFLIGKRKQEILFFILWLVPALVLYSINNVNYAAIPIFISPPLAILIAFALDYLSGFMEKSHLNLAHIRISRTPLNNIFAIVIALHLLVIFFSIDARLVGEKYRKYDPSGFNYHKLLAGDGYIYMLKNGIEDVSIKFGGSDSVIVLSDLNYRVLMYYLPDYQILWTRYLSQKQSSVDGETKLAFNRNDEIIRLPSFEYNGKKYWYYRINENQKIAIFTDEMIGNLQKNSRFSTLPGVEAAKAFVLDIDNMYAIYFAEGEFGTIDKRIAESLGLEK